MSLLKSIFKRSPKNKHDKTDDNEDNKNSDDDDEEYYYYNNHKLQHSDPSNKSNKSNKSNIPNTNRRRTTSNADYYINKKRSKHHKKQKKKKRKRKGTDIRDIENITNFYYNGGDDDDDEMDNKYIRTFNHNKSDTVIIRNDTNHSSSSDTAIIDKSQSLPSSSQKWTIHKKARFVEGINDNTKYKKVPRPTLTLNQSIPLEKDEKELIIRTNHLAQLTEANDEFHENIQLIVQQLQYDHVSCSNIIDMIRNGSSYLPSSELKLYITNKIKLTTFELQQKIEMIHNIISIFEDEYIMTFSIIKNGEIVHIIFEYICDDFLCQAPFLRILLCERINKFYKIQYLKEQIALIDSIGSTMSDPRYRYYSSIDVYIKLAIFWWNNNEFDKACFYVERSLKNCDMRDIRRAKLNYMLAHIYQFHIKQYIESNKHYKISISQNPTHGKSLFEYAYLLEKRFNDKINAIKYYKKHIELIENNTNNIIEYDIDVKSPKLSIFIGNGTNSFNANDSFVFTNNNNNNNKTRTLSQSISLSPKGKNNYYSDPDTDLSDIEEIEENKKQKNSNNNKKVISSAFNQKRKSQSLKYGYPVLTQLTLAPIHSEVSMTDSLLLGPAPSGSVSKSHSKSKSYNKKFEDEENGIEIETGNNDLIDLKETLAEENETEQIKQKALLSLEAIHEEIENEDDSDNDQDEHVLIGMAEDEHFGVDVGGGSDNEHNDNSERTGIGTMRMSLNLPKYKKKIAKKSRLRLAEIYGEENDNKNAQLQYETLLEYDANNFYNQLKYAHFLQYNLNDYDLSEFYYLKTIEQYRYKNGIKIEKGIEMFVKYCDLLINEGIKRKNDIFELIDKAKETIIDELHHRLMLQFGEILSDDDDSIYIDAAIECFKFVLLSLDKEYDYDAYLELGRIYHYDKNNLSLSYEYFMKALPLNHAKQDWHLHFELSMLMSDDEFIYENIKRPFNIAKDHASKSLDFCKDDQDKKELIQIYKSWSLIVV